MLEELAIQINQNKVVQRPNQNHNKGSRRSSPPRVKHINQPSGDSHKVQNASFLRTVNIQSFKEEELAQLNSEPFLQ